MRSTLILAALIVSSIALAADAPKGIKAGELVGGICDTTAKDGECAELLVTKAEDKAKLLKDAKQICPTIKAGDACPAANQVGSCRVGKDMINHFYSKGGKTYTAETAKAACDKNFGHWVE